MSFLGSILPAVGSLFGPVGTMLGGLAGGLLGGGGGGGGSPAPSGGGGIDYSALASAMAGMPAQQAETQAYSQMAQLLNQMGGAYSGLMGSIPITQDVTSALSSLFSPAGQDPNTQYQIGQAQAQSGRQADLYRQQLARRGITGPLAESMIQSGITMPEVGEEADIRARGAAGARQGQEFGLDWLQKMLPSAATLLGGQEKLGTAMGAQAQQAMEPFYLSQYMKGYGQGQVPGGSTMPPTDWMTGGSPMTPPSSSTDFSYLPGGVGGGWMGATAPIY